LINQDYEETNGKQTRETMRFSFVVSGGFGYHIPDLFENVSSFTKFQKALRLLELKDFTGVEVNLSFDDQHLLSRISESIRSQGLRLAAVGTGLIYAHKGLSFTDPDSTKRAKALSIVKELIRFASNEQATAIIGMVRGNPPRNSDVMKLLRASLIECDKTASEHKGRVALEPINRYETSLLNTASDTVRLIHEERLAATGLLLDTFHMNIEEQSIEATIRQNYASLAHFHIADSNRWPPGHGHLKINEHLRLLAELGYNGWVSAETLPKPNSAAAVKETARFLTLHSFLQR